MKERRDCVINQQRPNKQEYIRRLIQKQYDQLLDVCEQTKTEIESLTAGVGDNSFQKNAEIAKVQNLIFSMENDIQRKKKQTVASEVENKYQQLLNLYNQARNEIAVLESTLTDSSFDENSEFLAQELFMKAHNKGTLEGIAALNGLESQPLHSSLGQNEHLNYLTPNNSNPIHPQIPGQQGYPNSMPPVGGMMPSADVFNGQPQNRNHMGHTIESPVSDLNQVLHNSTPSHSIYPTPEQHGALNNNLGQSTASNEERNDPLMPTPSPQPTPEPIIESNPEINNNSVSNSGQIPETETPPTLEQKIFDDYAYDSNNSYDFDDMEPEKKSIVFKILNAIFYVLLIVTIAFVGFLGTQPRDAAPRDLFGFAAMTVLTTSMEPEIPRHALVVIRSAEQHELEVGNVVTYIRQNGTTVTHRIIEIIENYRGGPNRGFRMQGDNNVFPDADTIYGINVIGEVIYTNLLLGQILFFVQDQIILVAVFIVLIMALGFVVSNYFSSLDDEYYDDEEPSKPEKKSKKKR